LNWGFSNYKSYTPQVDKKLLTDVNILYGVKDKIKPVVDKSKSILIKNSTEEKIKQDISLALDVEAPVEKGQILGTVTVLLEGKKLETINLIAPESVEKLSFPMIFKRLLCSIS